MTLFEKIWWSVWLVVVAILICFLGTFVVPQEGQVTDDDESYLEPPDELCGSCRVFPNY